MKRTLLVAAIVLVGAVIALAAVLTRPAGVPDRAPDTEGRITHIENGRILVEEIPGEQKGDKCWFALSPETAVYRLTDGDGSRLERLEPSVLAVGMHVRAWASGPVLESYPCQGGAGTVVVVPAR